MKKLAAIILPLLLASLISVAGASQVQQPAQEVSASTASDIKTDLKLVQQQLEFYKSYFEVQNKLIEHQNGRISDIGLYLSISGVLITLLMLVVGYFSARDAKLVAVEEARKEVRDWLDTDGRKELSEKLQPELEQALKKIDEAAYKKLLGIDEDWGKIRSELFERFSRGAEEKQHGQEQWEKMTRIVQYLETIPQNEYRCDHWMLLGIWNTKNNKYEIAADDFDRAIKTSDTPADTATAMVNKGLALGLLKRHDKAIEVFDEVVGRYGESLDDVLREQVANALVNKGIIRVEEKRHDDAVAAYDDVVGRYSGSMASRVRMWVAYALNGSADIACMEGKEAWVSDDEAKARKILDKALIKVGDALVRLPETPLFLVTQGYILFLLDRIDEASPILSRAIKLGGEEVREAALKCAKVHRLPTDDAFEALIKSLPSQ